MRSVIDILDLSVEELDELVGLLDEVVASSEVAGIVFVSEEVGTSSATAVSVVVVATGVEPPPKNFPNILEKPPISYLSLLQYNPKKD